MIMTFALKKTIGASLHARATTMEHVYRLPNRFALILFPVRRLGGWHKHNVLNGRSAILPPSILTRLNRWRVSHGT